MLDAHRMRLAQCSAADDIASRVGQAGFRIWDLSDDDRVRTVILPGGDSVRMNIIVASPTSTDAFD